jgi:hypothetical protein
MMFVADRRSDSGPLAPYRFTWPWIVAKWSGS